MILDFGCTSHSCETVDGMMQELHKVPTKQLNELPEAPKEMLPRSSKRIGHCSVKV